ncbi:MAG TPA: malto-oligosyltrehalose trehalohydrolase [Enterovirga sp.]|nr:malto-oligosyltrehalose trehalohydrolase [Enterovirga sp.]
MQGRHGMPFGAELRDDGVRFALWAPSATEVELVLDGREHSLPHEGEGWWRLTLAEARAGSRYGFKIGGDLVVPDPASRFQPDDVHGLSLVTDPAAFVWSDTNWRGRPWEEAVIYEAHVGTATPQGTYAALADDLERLRALGITAVQLMPLADFAGARNWGYDGVLPYAPDSAYGTPDDLKRLIDRAHALGLMVMLDVVYNHFGPTGNYLHSYAKSFFTDRHETPWGAAINFDGADGRAVRDFFVHNALYWIEEFQFDGLRFDAVHAIIDDSEPNILAEIATRIRQSCPDRHVHLVLENEFNQARWLKRDERGRPPLYNAQWNDDIHHCWHALLTGEREAYYQDFAEDPLGQLARCLAEGFAYQGEVSPHSGKARGERSGELPPSAFVAFLQNHDQVGNRAFGERLNALASPEKLSLARAGLLLSPQIPMLFMGEEWAASAPFQFFVDFSAQPDLEQAVRDGRRREFRHFAAFADPEATLQIPDPTVAATFRRSTLDRSEASAPGHAEVVEDTRRLIALRAGEIVPLTKTRFLGAEARRPVPTALDVLWRFEGGTLRFLLNAGEEPVSFGTDALGTVIWRSHGLAEGANTLPPWTGIFAKGPAVR